MFALRQPKISKLARPVASRFFSTSGSNPSGMDKNLQFQNADLDTNAKPSEFDKDTIMQQIDPKTMLKKEPSYEYRELP